MTTEVSICKLTINKRYLKGSKYLDSYAKYRLIQLFESTPIDEDILKRYNKFIYHENDNQFLILEYLIDLEIDHDLKSLIIPGSMIIDYMPPIEFNKLQVDVNQEDIIVLLDY